MTGETEIGHILDNFTAKNLNYHGTAYELKLLMLFIARGLVKGNPFQLASGMGEAGSFDDLVMNWQLPHDCNRLTFLQSKHSNNLKKVICLKDLMSSLMRDGKRRKADWCLQMYFESFLKMKKCAKFNGSNVEMKEFILCCNFAFEDGAVYKENDQILELTQDIFEHYQHDVLPNAVYKFKRVFLGRALVASKLGEVNEAHDKKDIEEFLDKLFFATKQPDESTLVELIKQDLIQISGFRDLNLETIYSAFQTKVSDWVNSSNGKPFISVHGRLFFRKEMEKMNNQTFYETMKALGMSFHKDIIQELKLNHALEKSGMLILTNPGHAVMSTIKVFQILDSLERFRSNNYLLTCLNDFARLKVNILDYVNNIPNDFLLVIECGGYNVPEDQQRLLSKDLKSIADKLKNKLVLICKENDSFVKICKEKVNVFEELMDTKNKFCHLSLNSQAAILKCNISFQGIQLPLNALVDFDELKKIIDADTLFMLVTHQKVTLGEQLTSLGELTDYYINRSVIRHANISEDILRKEMSDLFAIGNIEESELIKIIEDGKKNHRSIENEPLHQTLRMPLMVNGIEKSSRTGLKMVENVLGINPDYKTLTREYAEVDPYPENPIRFIVLPNEKKSECFQQLCLDYPKHNIHWVEKAGNKLIWQQSRGSLSNMRKYLDKNVETGVVFDPKDLTDFESKLIIVSGEPGMGKSCFLSHLALHTQEVDPCLWIVRLNLPEFDENLRNFNAASWNEITEEKVVNLFFEFRNLTEFEKSLFENALKTPERVILLFDGFDEISVEGRKCIIKLLQFLKHKPVKKIWVCTRPYAMYSLEDELSLFSYHLQSVTRDDQMTILRKVWMTRLTIVEDSEMRLTSFANKLLDIFYESINENNEMAFGIPLHSKLLAEAFEKELKEFYTSGTSTIVDLRTLNLFELYQRFVDRKIKRPFEDKLKLDTTSFLVKKLLGDQIKASDHIHQLLAIHKLFSEKKGISCVLSENDKEFILRSTQNEDNAVLETGIIIGFAHNMPVFIHSTFVDYFSAKWIEENLSRNEVRCFFIKHVLKDESQGYSSDDAFEAKTIRTMVECMFGKPVANGNICSRSLFGLEQDIMFAFRWFFDHFLVERARKQSQRYNLYIAVLTNGQEILRYILKEIENTYALNINDNIGKTPLHMAASHGYCKITDILLQNKADVTICDDIFGWSALQYADAFRYWDIAVRLLDEGGIGEHMFNAIRLIKEGNNSLLHFAVELNSLKFVEILTESGADINALDSHGNSAVHNATRAGQLNLLQYFIQVKGADFCKFNKRGFSPIHIAAECLNLEVMIFFVNNCLPKIDQRNGSGFTALQIAVTCDDKNEKYRSLNIVDYLIETDHADLQVKTTDNNASLLHLAAAFGKIQIAKYLIEKRHVNYIAGDANGLTPAHYAAAAGHLDILKYFAEIKNVDLNILTHKKQSIIHLAALSGNLNLVKYLVEERNVSFLPTDAFGCTPAHNAAFMGNSDIVKYFFELKTFDLCILSHEKESIVHFAAESGNLDLVKYLVDDENFICTSADITGYTPAYFAALKGNLDIVKYFFQINKVDLSILTHDMLSLVHVAAESGNLNLVKYLVDEQNASCISADKRGCTPAYLAALKGNLDIVKYFIEIKTVDLSILTHDKRTLVHFAAQSGNLNLVKYLVDKQNVSCISADTRGYTPAHIAALKGYLDIVKYFLEVKNVDLSILTHNNRSLVHFAAESGNLNLVKYLAEEQNCNLVIFDIYGSSPLDIAASYDRANVIEYLIKYYERLRSKNCNDIVEFKATDSNKETDLKSPIIEISTGDALVTRITNAYNVIGCTPLMQACSLGNKQAVSMLLKYNVNYHCQNYSGHTALHLAIYCGHVEIVELLISYGARPNIVLQGFKTLLDIIVESKFYNTTTPSEVISRIYHLYLSKSCEISVCISDHLSECQSAVKYGNLNELERILAKVGFDVNDTDFYGRTPLERACEYGHLNIVQYIFEKKFSDLIISHYEIMSLLSISICKGQLDVVKYLFDFVRNDISKLTADLLLSHSVSSDCEEIISFVFHETKNVCASFTAYKNVFTSTGSSFLIASAEYGNRNSAQAFLDLGDDVNAQNDLGETALHTAVKCEHPNFVKFLLDNHADVRIANKNGKIPLDLAREIMEQPYGYHECVKDMADLLESYTAKIKFPVFELL